MTHPYTKYLHCFHFKVYTFAGVTAILAGVTHSLLCLTYQRHSTYFFLLKVFTTFIGVCYNFCLTFSLFSSILLPIWFSLT